MHIMQIHFISEQEREKKNSDLVIYNSSEKFCQTKWLLQISAVMLLWYVKHWM